MALWPVTLTDTRTVTHTVRLTVTQIVTTRLLYFEFRSLSLVIMIIMFVLVIATVHAGLSRVGE